MKVVVLAFLCFTGVTFAEARTSTSPTIAEAEEFIKKAKARLAELSVKTFISRWDLIRCQRRSGSVRSSSSLPIAT